VRSNFLPVLSALLVAVPIGCGGEQQGAPPGHLLGPGGVSTQYTLSVTVTPAPNLPKKANLVFIGFSEDQVDGNHPGKGTIPSFYWKSAKLRIKSPITLEVPLPEVVNLLVIVDADGDGKPNPEERSTSLLIDFKAAETPMILIDQAFADLGGPPRDGPLRDLVIDTTRVARKVDASEVVVLVLGYEEDMLRDGMPRSRAVPGFMWVSEPMKFVPQLRLQAPVPAIPGLIALVMLDIDGDGLPTPDEPISRAFTDFTPPPEGTPWRVELIRLFEPPRGGAKALNAPTGGDTDGISARLVLDAEPRIKIVRKSRVMVVGYDEDDIEDDKPLSDGEPSFLWWRDKPEIDWPITVDGRVPSEGRYLVVVDLDENLRPTAGDLTTALTAPPDPNVDSDIILVLDRTLDFAEGEDDEERP
jgi:hypothetical protein